jgi:dUTPase
VLVFLPGTIFRKILMFSAYLLIPSLELLNTSIEPFVIKKGDRIAQAVISKVEIASFEFVEDLNDTARSSGGFGSTGVI